MWLYLQGLHLLPGKEGVQEGLHLLPGKEGVQGRLHLLPGKEGVQGLTTGKQEGSATSNGGGSHAGPLQERRFCSVQQGRKSAQKYALQPWAE